MPKAYAVDLRKKILEVYLEKESSILEIANRFKVSESTVKRIAKRHRETGDVVLYLHHAGRHELIDDEGKQLLKKIVTDTPDVTLTELQEKYYELQGIKPVLAVFHRVLKELKFSYKKKSHFAQQREREDIKKKRGIYRIH